MRELFAEDHLAEERRSRLMPTPDLITDEDRQRYQHLLIAVNARLAAEGGLGFVPQDWRLRPPGMPAPGPDALQIGGWEDLLVIADDVGIDTSAF